MSQEEARGMVDEVIEAFQADPSLDVIAEFRKRVTTSWGREFLDDLEQRRKGIENRMRAAFTQNAEIVAEKATGEAIASYHQRVVTPILGQVLGELYAIQFELALLKHGQSDMTGMDENALRKFPAFAGLPVYDESDAGNCEKLDRPQDGSTVREATTAEEVKRHLRDSSLTPVGAIRHHSDSGQSAVFAYFHRRP